MSSAAQSRMAMTSGSSRRTASPQEAHGTDKLRVRWHLPVKVQAPNSVSRHASSPRLTPSTVASTDRKRMSILPVSTPSGCGHPHPEIGLRIIRHILEHGLYLSRFCLDLLFREFNDEFSHTLSIF